MKIINYIKKKEIILTNEEKESYENQKVCYMCEKEFCTDTNDENTFKLYHKVRDIAIIQENLEELPIIFVI